MENLLNYIKNIGYFLILMSLVSNVMPDNSYKKYCRMFCGIILVVLVINPFYEFLEFNGDIKDILVSASYESQAKELENQLKISESSTKDKIISEYERLIANELQGIATTEGLYIMRVELDIVEENDIRLNEIKVLVTEDKEDMEDEDINSSTIKIDSIIIGNDENNDSKTYIINPKVLAFINNAAKHLKVDTGIILVESYKGNDYGE